ncbi:unnamed protein product [Rotaria sordida]|uniref:Plastocyanin-like domain-containing protein n=1 Tax=Rotaria sordida TaxID=392033 RepID=A0A814J9Z7_9BILA|nr:unnamed protein product [Rotaria sordida]CAF3745892.1 unnamed protein product [Rotaria sordida]CAF3826792.1 unnamed protein product [Rotaria sordida]
MITTFILFNFAVILSEATTVQYNWTIHYAKYDPDGIYHIVIAIDDDDGIFNFLGPTIRACKNNIIQVIVHNNLPNESTSIHWHGIHQLNTPWMDGVSHITQYPIMPMQSFDYTFVASSVGTHWFHSHIGAQYADGLFGVPIVEDSEDSYEGLPEFLFTMTEW